MRRTKLILASAVLVVPVALAIGVKIVKGSEPPGRLVDNLDGTVTDTATQLMWLQTTPPFASNQAAALAACASYDAGAFTAGWRLPGVKELTSIVDYESPTAPTIDTAIFPGTNASTSEPYYTTSPTLCVTFATGAVSATECTTNNPYRCVHSLAAVGDAGP
jgi:hypothetical protein